MSHKGPFYIVLIFLLNGYQVLSYSALDYKNAGKRIKKSDWDYLELQVDTANTNEHTSLFIVLKLSS